MTRAKHPTRMLIAPLLAVAFVAAACDAPTRTNDYRINHPIKVTKETVSLAVKLPVPDAGPAGLERVAFERFVKRYLESGQGELKIDAAAADQAAALDMRQRLIDEGVLGRQIVVRNGDAGAGRLTMSYVSAVAIPPECQDWSSNATYNWSNKTQSNFGCATQRNLGLMVSDPNDLEQAKPMTGADGERNAGIVGNYRTPTAKAGAKQTSAKGATGK